MNVRPLPHELADVRRIEAVSFRSFPSASTHYDGTWAIRLTAGHPAKRLNSVTPLDPNDHSDLERRVELAQLRFEGFGRPLVFRLSPLAPPELDALLESRGWDRFQESLVMAKPLDRDALAQAVDHLPLKDMGRWVDASLALANADGDRKPGMVEVLSAIEAETGLFLSEDAEGRPLSAVRCVCENDLAGIFELETNGARRREGHGRAILASALKWAAARRAQTAWLQVEAANAAALSLYREFGFVELYRYVYRQAPA